MWQKALIIAVGSATILAQATPGPQQRPTSIFSVVRDASTVAPLSDVYVSVADGGTMTDSQGRFTVEGLDPGLQWIRASDKGRGAHGEVYVVVSSGQQAKAETRLKLGGGITGRVVDEDWQAVIGATVLLLSRTYEFGEQCYSPDEAVSTGRDGEYRLAGVPPEHAFLTLAKKPLKAFSPKLEPPADRENSEHILLRSFYRNARDIRSVLTVTLAPGETRAGVDIHMSATPSHCIAGAVDRVGDPGVLSLSLTKRLSFKSGWALFPGTVDVKPDGQFRACGLHPGEQHVSGSGASTDQRLFALGDVVVIDQDVRDLSLQGRRVPPISGELTINWTMPDCGRSGMTWGLCCRKRFAGADSRTVT